MEIKNWKLLEKDVSESEHRNGKAGRSEGRNASRHWHLRFIMSSGACFNMEKLSCHPDI